MATSSVFGPRFKRDLLKRVTKDLFDETWRYFRKRLDRICDEQQVLKGGNALFSYRSQIYMHSLLTGGMSYKAHPLVQELHENMDGYLADHKKFLDQEQAVIQQYLTNALNICKTPDDLVKVMPAHTHRIIMPYIERHLGAYPATISDVHINNFRTQYAQYDAAFKERLLANLLTQ